VYPIDYRAFFLYLASWIRHGRQDELMNVPELLETVFDESRNLLKAVPGDVVERVIKGLDHADRIFCGAQGRSGYVLRCFCMRLMHLGYRAFFVGETITPRIAKADILVVLSGSGQTALTYELLKVGQQQGALTCGMIGVEDSPIGRALDLKVCLPGGSKRGYPNAACSVQPPGSLFEQAAFVMLETMALALYQMQGSDGRALLERHTNLE
jgi:6-phospho-3-hexuloisomerase